MYATALYKSRVESGARTHDTRNHNPMLCQLSYDHHARFSKKRVDFSKAGAKVLLFFETTKYFCDFFA